MSAELEGFAKTMITMTIPFNTTTSTTVLKNERVGCMASGVKILNDFAGCNNLLVGANERTIVRKNIFPWSSAGRDDLSEGLVVTYEYY